MKKITFLLEELNNNTKKLNKLLRNINISMIWLTIINFLTAVILIYIFVLK